jgi:hypothetical protein
LPSHVDRYPAFLNTVLGTSGPTPLARYSGSTVALGTTMLLQLLVFAPGAFAATPIPHPHSDFADPTLGYAGMTVVNDPIGGREPEIRCTPLDVTTSLYGTTLTNPCAGNPAPPCSTDAGINAPVPGAMTSRIRYQNPATVGTHTWFGFHISARDLDGDVPSQH